MALLGACDTLCHKLLEDLEYRSSIMTLFQNRNCEESGNSLRLDDLSDHSNGYRDGVERMSVDIARTQFPSEAVTLGGTVDHGILNHSLGSLPLIDRLRVRLEPYLDPEGEDPLVEFWRDVIGPENPLLWESYRIRELAGGASEGACSYLSPFTGQLVVGKAYLVNIDGQTTASHGPIEEIMEQTHRWSEDGSGPKLIDVAFEIEGAGRFSLYISMEHFGEPSFGQAVVFGDGSAFERINTFNHPECGKISVPAEIRTWAREAILSILDEHGDPRLENALFRVVVPEPGKDVPTGEFVREVIHQENGEEFRYIVQIGRIDPWRIPNNSDDHLRFSTDPAIPYDSVHFTRRWQNVELGQSAKLLDLSHGSLGAEELIHHLPREIRELPIAALEANPIKCQEIPGLEGLPITGCRLTVVLGRGWEKHITVPEDLTGPLPLSARLTIDCFVDSRDNAVLAEVNASLGTQKHYIVLPPPEGSTGQFRELTLIRQEEVSAPHKSVAPFMDWNFSVQPKSALGREV